MLFRSRQQVQLAMREDGSADVETRGQKAAVCSTIDTEQLNSDLSSYEDGPTVQKYPFDKTQP